MLCATLLCGLETFTTEKIYTLVCDSLCLEPLTQIPVARLLISEVAKINGKWWYKVDSSKLSLMMLSLMSLYLVTKQLIPELYICSLAFEDHIVQVLVPELLPGAALTRALSTPLLKANHVQVNSRCGRVGWQSRLEKMAGILTTEISTLVSTKLGHFKQTPKKNCDIL